MEIEVLLSVAMKFGARRANQLGQALIEYAFLFVLVATITVAVVALAGNQVQSTIDNIQQHLVHLTDHDWQVTNP
jgi:Flp pilus assembly pilin Flp